MSDLGAGGTVDYSGLPQRWTAGYKSNATDIRRTIAPTPTQIGTKQFKAHDATLVGFSAAGEAFGKTSTRLNSGVLFRVVDSASTSFCHVGISADGLAVDDCILLEEGDEIFIPASDLNLISIFSNAGTAGITLSMLGE
tara:strand:+ start:649 stop:1065 length:417 start_codon:yes stop_codon:yes gene_type:complete